MENKQTAVEWLKELVDTYLAMSPYEIEIPEKFYLEAKKKEKEQIISAWENGSFSQINSDFLFFEEQSEIYFNQQYGNNS